MRLANFILTAVADPTVPSSLGFPELRHLRGRWAVCWYRDVLPASDESQPHVNVSFRNLQASEFRTVPVPVTALGQVRLGAILKDGALHADFLLATERFRVDLARDCTIQVPRWLGSAIRRDDHWLTRVPFSGFVLRLALSRGRHLWIPSLEFFSRCFRTAVVRLG